MRKSVKISIIVAVILVIAGAVIGKFGYSLIDWNKDGKNTMQNKTSYKGSDIVSLSADCDSANITVYKASGSDILLNWDEDDKRRCDITNDGGELKITYRDHRKWYEYLRFGVNVKTYELSIGLPEAYTGALNLSTGSGNVKAENLSVSDDVSFSTASGNVSVNGVSTAGSLKLSLSSGNITASNLSSGAGVEFKNVSGNIKAENVTLNGDFSAQTSSGNLKIYSISGAKEVSLKCVSGGIDFSDITAEDLYVTASSGNVTFSDIYADKSIELKAVSGNVTGSISDDIKNYTIESSCVSGNNSLPESASYGDKTLTVKVSSGNIKVDFDK